MRRFAEDMDRLFEDYEIRHGSGMPRLLSRGRELLRREAGLVPADWSPKVDVKERDGKFIVRADLPGMSKDSVKVEARDGLLTIQGERRQEAKEEHEGHYYSECSYGTFSRSIPLPEGIDISAADATFRDGVLEITMPAPKQVGRVGRSVPVRS
jgi:HSP20 family protein